MSAATRQDNRIVRISFIGMMAAIIFVGNYLRIPFMGTKLTVVNALCVLGGLLFGPAAGFLSAGIGSFLYDIVTGYGLESLITFVSKGAIGLIAGFIGYHASRADKPSAKEHTLVVLASIIGAFTYVALYMLKTFIFGMTVKGLGFDGTMVSMASKLPGSALNALFASIVAPLLLTALRPALKHAGLNL